MNTTQDTLDHDSHAGSVEQTTTRILDRPVASVDAEHPTLEPPARRHWLGWVLVVAALVAAAALAMSLVVGGDPSAPVGDAKDHPGYGQVTPVVAAPVGDAKDHPGYGQVTPVVAAPVGDAKDHPGYGQVTTVVATAGDAKDHPGYGSSTAD